jgi:hypothetical protein
MSVIFDLQLDVVGVGFLLVFDFPAPPKGRMRQEGLAKPIRDSAWKAQERLCRRYRKLARAGKSSTVVTTAIARELAGFAWAIATHVQAAAA